MQANLTNDLICVYMCLPQIYFLSTINTKVCYQHPYFSFLPSLLPLFTFLLKFYLLSNGGEGIEMPEHFQTGPCRGLGNLRYLSSLSLPVSLSATFSSFLPTPPTNNSINKWKIKECYKSSNIYLCWII